MGTLLKKPLNHENSMGLVRYYLAFAVFVAHFNVVFDTDIYFPTSSYNAVGGFFALSGFLVYRSFLKSTSVKSYLLKRARRILPPYIFIVLVCAFGLVLVSDLSLKDYFFNIQWIKYLVSNLLFLNFIEPELPGVFRNLGVHAVNGSLWTMKIEVMLYVSVPVVAWLFSKVHRKWEKADIMMLFGAIYLFSIIYRITFHELYAAYGHELFNILSRQVFGQLMYFYAGVFIYFQYKRFMRYRLHIVAGCVLFMLLGDYIPYYQFIISPLVVSSLVIFFSSFKMMPVFNRHNISYDIYLFHMPIMMTVCSFAGKDTSGVFGSFGIVLVLTILLGYMVWFGIERRFMLRNSAQKNVPTGEMSIGAR